MEFELLLSFLGASVLLTVMPGPDNIFVLTESLTTGHRNGIAISLGLCSGILIHTVAAATGLSIIIQNSAIAFTIIKYLGAGYLFYLAFLSIRDKKPVTGFDVKRTGEERNFLQLVRKGFFMNVLNPKVSLFFIAFLPQFVSKTGFAVPFQMLFLGVVFMTQAVAIFTAISLLSGRLTRFVNSPRFWKITKWSKVSVLAGLGLTLAISKS